MIVAGWKPAFPVKPAFLVKPALSRSLRDSCWFARSGQQLGKIVVDAGGAEVRLATERLAQVAHAVLTIVQEFDDGEDVIVGLVERGEDLVARHGDGLGAAQRPR